MTTHPPQHHGAAGAPRQQTPMTDHPGRWHPLGRTRHEDLEILAAGSDTGWWDQHGHPAPWPQDFLDPQAGWTTTGPPPTNAEKDRHDSPF